MSPQEITRLRLNNQMIASSSLSTPGAVLNWMGPIQAQDYAMSKWAIGCRIPGCTENSIEVAIHSGTIIRTHILRPTWHWVSAEDIGWILALTAPKIKSLMKSYINAVELTPAIFKKSNAVMAKVLSGNNHLTRTALAEQLTQSKINCDNRLPLLLAWAELEGLICSGVPQGKNQTYALLEERVKVQTSIDKEEALLRLAKRYFTAHGPATLGDFTWWSGLPVADARKALEMAKPLLEEIVTKEDTYWLSPTTAAVNSTAKSCYLLPAFDEFLIGYKDRTAAIAKELQPKAFTNNGIFRPIVVLDGKVKGIWSRSFNKDKVTMKIDLFERSTNTIENAIKPQGKRYGAFLDKELEITR